MKLTPANVVLIIISLGCLIYFNSLFNGFVWDDAEQIVNNQAIRSLGNLPIFFSGSTFNRGGSEELFGLFYRPIATTSLSLVYTFFGLNAWAYHLFSVLIHLTTAALVFLLFRKFISANLALLLTLVFLVHPINVEAVAYISALPNILFVLFGLLSILILTVDRLNRLVRILVSGLLLLLSVLSKESGFVFGPLLIFYAYFFQRSFLVPGLVAGLLVSLVYGFLRLSVAKVSIFHSGITPIMQASLRERLLSAPQIVVTYLKTFFFPQDLAISQHWLNTRVDFLNFFLPLILVVALLLGLVVLGWYLKKKPHPDQYPPYLFFVSLFLLSLILHSNLVPLDMTVAERWFYLPMIGLLGIAGLGLQQFGHLRRWGWIGILIIVLLSARTMTRNFDWKDNFTLARHDVLINQNSFELENLLGFELLNRGRLDEAQRHLEKSVNLKAYGINLNNLASLYLAQRDYPKAIETFKQASRYGYYKSFENWASVALLHGSASESKQAVLQGLNLYPTNPKLWYILALAEYKLGQPENALAAALSYARYKKTKSAQTLYQNIKDRVAIEKILGQ